jgi:hypothetical protein
MKTNKMCHHQLDFVKMATKHFLVVDNVWTKNSKTDIDGLTCLHYQIFIDNEWFII